MRSAVQFRHNSLCRRRVSRVIDWDPNKTACACRHLFMVRLKTEKGVMTR